MGKIHVLRKTEHSGARWEATFKQSQINDREKQRVDAAIGRLRWVELPVPGDIEVKVPPLMEITYHRYCIPQTSLNLVYDFGEDEEGSWLFLFALHRMCA